MPIYGRYEPAEAMRDLGISLAHAVTGMAQTELESRKMDLALKESDLKLGLLEKESQVNTLKAQLEGEVRKTSLAQKAEEMGMQRQRDIVAAEHGKAMEKISLGQLGVQQSEFNLKKQEYERQHAEKTWGEVLERAAPPHVYQYVKDAYGDDFLKKKTTLAEAEPAIKQLYIDNKGEMYNLGLMKAADQIKTSNKRLKELTPLVAMGNANAIAETDQIMTEREKTLGTAESTLKFLTSQGKIDQLYKVMVDSGMSPDDAGKASVELANAYKSGQFKFIEGPMDVKDWAIKVGLKGDDHPINPKEKAAPLIEKILKGKATKEQAIEAIRSGDKTENLRPSQIDAILAALEDGLSRKKEKPTKEIKKPEITTEQERPAAGERYSPVATTATRLWEALSAPPPKRPGWNERRFQEWVGNRGE
jgi:hypothetical protein